MAPVKSHSRRSGNKRTRVRSHTRKKYWVQTAVKKPGALHRMLRIPEGKKIPLHRLKKAARTGSLILKRRANFALNARKFKRRTK